MKLIIGSYRGVELVQRAIASLERNARGITSVEIVDDSPDPSTPFALRDLALTNVDWTNERELPMWPTVHKVGGTGGKGYNAAMRAVCAVAGADMFIFWEEDFVLTEPVDFNQLGWDLQKHPDWAQIALQRGPWFPNEKAAGGMLPGLVQRLGIDRVQLRNEDGYLTQRGTFTCNPAVWQRGIARRGWPLGQWSEDKMRDRLIRRGYRFAFAPGVRVMHDGVRSGHGY